MVGNYVLLCVYAGCLVYSLNYNEFVKFINFEDLPLVDLMYLVFTGMPGEGCRRQFRSLLLCLCDVIGALIHSLCFLVIMNLNKRFSTVTISLN